MKVTKLYIDTFTLKERVGYRIIQNGINTVEVSFFRLEEWLTKVVKESDIVIIVGLNLRIEVEGYILSDLYTQTYGDLLFYHKDKKYKQSIVLVTSVSYFYGIGFLITTDGKVYVHIDMDNLYYSTLKGILRNLLYIHRIQIVIEIPSLEYAVKEFFLTRPTLFTVENDVIKRKHFKRERSLFVTVKDANNVTAIFSDGVVLWSLEDIKYKDILDIGLEILAYKHKYVSINISSSDVKSISLVNYLKLFIK